ncbi:ribosome hibernation-promoting factor, HPF/YfiA family [Thaumasiovibrio subtropicus]|uniref:ribosome hibernation-promoting factor, HPF/YfiA family n=1 Tax=Thaumasiovibrio subtropicus TaxID=1891207 RepID=UPI000B352F02|nr:ribosome-associated translation inhibitor RaiA [Thaumasiovibrio subtropicus]
MNLEITGKNLEVTPAIRARIEAKFTKLEKWEVPLLKRHAVISQEPNKRFKIEASASIPGGKLIASADHEDMYGAITDMFQKMERQMNKQQHKPEARRASHAQPVVETTEEEAE